MSLFERNESDVEPLNVKSIIQLVDEYAELHSMNSFLIHAMTSVMSSHQPVSEDVKQGAKHFALTVQNKSNELKSALSNVKENTLLLRK